jgi:sugar lactone lactonase YvrE
VKQSVEISVALDWDAVCGEGPVWSAEHERVHWVDIVAGQILSTDRRTLATEVIQLPTMVGAAVPAHSGGFVAAVTEGFALVGTDGSFDVRAACLAPGTRMNDAKCDSRGRFWAGSTDMGFAAGGGALWMLDENWNAKKVLDGLTLPNGMGWSPDNSTFYLIDSIERKVLSFDFNEETGSLSSRRDFVVFSDRDGGLPDGLCVDNEGNLWIAMYGGSELVVCNPAGRVVRTVALPVSQPTSCAFVGPTLDELWVTSAADGLADPGINGSILVVTGLGAHGIPVGEFAG